MIGNHCLHPNFSSPPLSCCLTFHPTTVVLAQDMRHLQEFTKNQHDLFSKFDSLMTEFHRDRDSLQQQLFFKEEEVCWRLFVSVCVCVLCSDALSWDL